MGKPYKITREFYTIMQCGNCFLLIDLQMVMFYLFVWMLKNKPRSNSELNTILTRGIRS